MFILEAADRIWIGSAVELVTEDRDVAWAERSYRKHVALKHFVGRYVEADNANSNRQMWSLADLQDHYQTIRDTPVDWHHNPKRCIGFYTDAELLYPMNNQANDDGIMNPFVETLGVLWAHNFPEEVSLIEKAHAEGVMAQSMECIAKSVTCAGPKGCGKEFAYSGPRSDTYCACLNDGPGHRQLNQPTFLGGGLLIPPVAPGWRKAQIKDLSSLMKEHAEGIDRAYSGIAGEFPHLESKDWENIMHLLVLSTVK